MSPAELSGLAAGLFVGLGVALLLRRMPAFRIKARRHAAKYTSPIKSSTAATTRSI